MSGTPDAGGNGTPDSGGGGGSTVACAADSTIPAEPKYPTTCMSLSATKNVPDGSAATGSLDTSAITSALGSNSCVKLVASGSNNALLVDSLSIPSGKTLWVDAGVTLYGKILTSSTLITLGSGASLVGEGAVDAQGGEPASAGGQSAWDQSDALRASNGSATLPQMINWTGSNVTLYKIHVHNAQKFHIVPGGSQFLIWGITLKTPSRATNSYGAALTPYNARNTDAIDPTGGASHGFIVYNNISTGDDHIAIKGATAIGNIEVLHNHFGSGHGMSIGSETNGGVSNVDVCDLTVDGSLRPTGGSPPADVNGLRIKSDASRGGKVSNITYDQVCIRDVDNPIVFNPNYSTKTGSLIPSYQNISVSNVHATSQSIAQVVTVDGYDSSHITTATLNNIVVDGSGGASFASTYATITLGPGNVTPMPTASSNVTITNHISGSSTPIDCSSRWITF
jgi:polygalacturonase